jgi:hypothetical protein
VYDEIIALTPAENQGNWHSITLEMSKASAIGFGVGMGFVTGHRKGFDIPIVPINNVLRDCIVTEIGDGTGGNV